MKHQGGEEFDVRFRAMPSDIPVPARLKQLLKTAGRAFGLRCVNVAAVPPGLRQDEPGEAEAARKPSGEEIVPQERA
jgi:hypothetical protein